MVTYSLDFVRSLPVQHPQLASFKLCESGVTDCQFWFRQEEYRSLTLFLIHALQTDKKMCVSLMARVVWKYMLKSEFFLWFLLWFTFSFCIPKIASIALSCFLLPVCTEGGRLLRPVVFFLSDCVFTHTRFNNRFIVQMFFCFFLCLFLSRDVFCKSPA